MIYVFLFSVCIVDQMFWEVMQLRKEMSLAKLGYFKEELWCSAWDHAWTSLKTWKMTEYFYGYLIFISFQGVGPRLFPSFANYTEKYYDFF